MDRREQQAECGLSGEARQAGKPARFRDQEV
jgi:hypothetical protein